MNKYYKYLEVFDDYKTHHIFDYDHVQMTEYCCNNKGIASILLSLFDHGEYYLTERENFVKSLLTYSYLTGKYTNLKGCLDYLTETETNGNECISYFILRYMDEKDLMEYGISYRLPWNTPKGNKLVDRRLAKEMLLKIPGEHIRCKFEGETDSTDSTDSTDTEL